MIRGLPKLAFAVIALAVPAAARANCYPVKPFSQIGNQLSNYVLFPENAQATPGTVIGRFWQPGMRFSTNEGSCDETRWLTRCYDCPVPNHGPVYQVDGVLGDMPCLAGCPDGEMIVLLQDLVPNVGGLFAVGRVTEIPGSYPRFDYSRIEKNWGLVPIPPPQVHNVDVIDGSTLRVEMLFDDPVFGYFTTGEGFPTETISAIRVYTFSGITPPVNRASWTQVARFPYLGGLTAGTANILGACPDSEESLRFVAAAVELDDGQFVTDYVSAASQVSCTAQAPVGAGHVPESGTDAMRVSRSNTGDLTLDWTEACTVGALYEVYQGILGEWADPQPITCGVNAQTFSFREPEESAYYLVVPYVNRIRPPIAEGSYGRLRDGSERPVSAYACRPQLIVPCN